MLYVAPFTAKTVPRTVSPHDADGRPWYRLGKREDGQEGRYEYVAKIPEDLKAYPAAGANSR